MSGQGELASSYFELPARRRQPAWRLGLFLLSALGVHLIWLLLAFGTVSRTAPAATLPVLTVRVVERVAVRPWVAQVKPVEAPQIVDRRQRVEPPRPVEAPAKPRRTTPRRTSVAAVNKALPTPPAVSTAAVTASATPALAAAATTLAAPAAAPAAAAAPAPLVAARFDADYLRNPPPVYPAASRRLGEEGRVLLRIRVSVEGLPLTVEVRQSSGFRRLDDAARAAVERWRFVPARQGSEAVESSVLVPLQFTLNG